MLLKKRVERGMDTMRERNRRYLESQGQYTGPEEIPVEETDRGEGETGLRSYMKGTVDAVKSDSEKWDRLDEIEASKKALEEYRKKNEELDFEKGDVMAIIIAAFVTFAPVFLGIVALMALAWVLLT